MPVSCFCLSPFALLPHSRLFHSTPCSFWTCPILPPSALSRRRPGRLHVSKLWSKKSCASSLVPGPPLFSSSLSAEQLPQNPRRSRGGSAVEDRAGSTGSSDLQLTWFVLPFLLNKPQREGRDFYKIKYTRYVSLVQCVLVSPASLWGLWMNGLKGLLKAL